MRLRMLVLSLFVTVRVFAADPPADPWLSKALQTPYREDIPVDEKLAGVAQLWAEARFDFANFDLVPDLDWDAQLPKYLERVRASKSTAGYYRALIEMCALLHDGHSDVSVPGWLAPEFYSQPLMRTRFIDGHVLVHTVFSDELRAEGVVPGLEVIAIDRVPVREYAEKRVTPYVSASTPQDRDNRSFGNELLMGPAGKPVTLTLVDARGKLFERAVPRVAFKDWLDLRPKLPLLEFRVLPGNVGYLALNSFNDKALMEQFAAAWDQIAKTKALIIDVRENGGGNSSYAWDILGCLTNKPFRTSSWRTRNYRPSYRAWKSDEVPKWDVHADGEHKPDGQKLYTNPVVLLISVRTFSAAEDFAVAFDAMDRGKIVGEPSGGSTGQPLFFKLPGGGSARICTKRDTYPDGKEFIGVGIQPDVLVKSTVEDFRAGRDPVLARALLVVYPERSEGSPAAPH